MFIRSRLRRKRPSSWCQTNSNDPNTCEGSTKTPRALASLVQHRVAGAFSSLLLEAERLGQAVMAEGCRREDGGGAIEVSRRVA